MERAIPAPRESERLATGHEDANARAGFENGLNKSCRRRNKVFAVVQHEQQLFRFEIVLEPLQKRTPGLLLNTERGGDRLRDELLVGDGSQLCEPNTVRDLSTTLDATARLRRVFPHPPLPESVNSRVSQRSEQSSATSRSLPIKLVSWRGRLCRRIPRG